MAALFQCFRRKRSNSHDENDLQNKGNEISHQKLESKGKKVDTILQCSHCKSTLHGYWEKHEENNKDGAICGKMIRGDRNSRSSAEHGSASDGHSPTSSLPPQVMGGNGSINYVPDYRPSVRANITGMAYMPVSKDAPEYKMNHQRRGKALIFNFDEWNNTTIPSLSLDPRKGSRKDKTDLTRCLLNLGFEVEAHDNLRRQDYDGVIKKVQEEDHSDADCLIIAVMTHGEKNSIYLSDGSLIPVNTVWEEFEANKCPTLAGKPKIFLIQACRGKRYDHGTRLASERQSGVSPFQMLNDVTDSGTFSYVIPNAADIIVAFSCPLGHYSWRHPENGSWFIQSICKVFNRDAYKENMDLQNLLTTVAREVAVNFVSDTIQYESNRKKQVPSTSSTLIRQVIFRPKFYKVFANGETNESATQTITQINGNGSQIQLESVQAAVAAAQSYIAENDEELIMNRNVQPPDTLPVMVLQETAIDGNVEQLPLSLANEESDPDLVNEPANSASSEDLTQAALSLSGIPPQDQSSRH